MASSANLHPIIWKKIIQASWAAGLFEGEGSLVYTISDGNIGNWSEIRDEFIEGARRHNYFHLQVSKGNRKLPQMYDDLNEAGLNAVHDDGSNSRILVDLTQKRIYGAK